jgi:hypothetical protein
MWLVASVCLSVCLSVLGYSEPRFFEVTVNNSFSGAITQHIANGLADVHGAAQAILLAHVGALADCVVHPPRAVPAAAAAAAAAAGPLQLPSHTLKTGFAAYRQEILELLYVVRGAQVPSISVTQSTGSRERPLLWLWPRMCVHACAGGLDRHRCWRDQTTPPANWTALTPSSGSFSRTRFLNSSAYQ